MNPGILKWYKFLPGVFAGAALLIHSAVAAPLDLEFSLHKKGSAKHGPTLLVIGGIQGDEPGGFNAASMLAMHYRINKGQLWVVPNLNFESIIKRSRGVYGDMNRKFLSLHRDDPEYEAVEKIKSIILQKQVDVVLNLHDGSGFYRPVYIDRLRNKNRWGQSIIIDQESVGSGKYSALDAMARKAVKKINTAIPKKSYHYRVRNTDTSNGNKDMEKTLTYFAIRHNKPAFGIEASKQFNTHQRAYYHLRAVEAFMQQMGISYKRDFKLSMKNVRKVINKDLKLTLHDNRIQLDMKGIRSRLGYVPMKKGAPLQFDTSNPLMAVIKTKRKYKVRYGNRGVTLLQPEYLEFDNSLTDVELIIDGEEKRIPIGSEVEVSQSFMVRQQAGYRVNVIGYRHKKRRNESGLVIHRKDIARRFSVDKRARRFRVEIYNKQKFCGMLLVNFVDKENKDGQKVAFMQEKISLPD